MKILEKKERRLGIKLFLKGDRCVGPKCALTRRSYPPGAHGKKRKRGRGSEYASLLQEKQKVRYFYGLDDKSVKRYSDQAAQAPGVFSVNFLKGIERRLDNTVFRLGFAPSRRAARHLVSYGHIKVNGRAVRIPSYQVKKNDIISIKDSSLGSGLFSEFEMRLKNHEAPLWLELDKSKKVAKVREMPSVEDQTDFEITKIKEFYSR